MTFPLRPAPKPRTLAGVMADLAVLREEVTTTLPGTVEREAIYAEFDVRHDERRRLEGIEL